MSADDTADLAKFDPDFTEGIKNKVGGFIKRYFRLASRAASLGRHGGGKMGPAFVLDFRSFRGLGDR